jgi:hypothetical protein
MMSAQARGALFIASVIVIVAALMFIFGALP